MLINDILEMSRIDNGQLKLEFKPMDLCLLLEELGELFMAQMQQKRIDFAVHTSQIRNRYVWCDKTSLNRVLLNIISNAYKFTPQGGNISAAIYEVDSNENGYGSYEICVKDSGIGMSKEFVSKMFNAFERERTSTASGMEGTGLGLAITKSIVDLMGGTIEVFTSPGNGTEIDIHIKFRLATAKDMKKEKIDEVTPAETVDFASKRLLPGYYDAILMDIQMPVMDGYEATREIRALPDPKLAEIPILAMTANAFPEDIKAAEEAGMQAHIAKPIDVNVLKKELKKVIGK